MFIEIDNKSNYVLVKFNLQIGTHFNRKTYMSSD